MIPVSSNSMTKKTVPTSSNAFSSKTTPTSTNAFTQKQVRIAGAVWQGTNLSDAGIDGDLGDPGLFGANEAGGFSHFQNVDQPVIDHD